MCGTPGCGLVGWTQGGGTAHLQGWMSMAPAPGCVCAYLCSHGIYQVSAGCSMAAYFLGLVSRLHTNISAHTTESGRARAFAFVSAAVDTLFNIINLIYFAFLLLFFISCQNTA